MQEALRKVLVVDDDEMICDVTCKMLGVLGYEANHCLDSKGAVAMYKSGRRFDFVLLDLNMGPQNHDGVSTLLSLRAIDMNVVAACSTGSCNETDKLLKFGFSYVFAKPFGLDELRRGMERLCA